MKQQSAVTIGNTILFLANQSFALTPQYCVLSREETNTNVLVFDLTRPGLNHTIYGISVEQAFW